MKNRKKHLNLPTYTKKQTNNTEYKCKKAKRTLNTSQTIENGRTAKPTSKSATAKLTMKKFVTLLNLWEQNTAAITKQLPTITKTFINARKASDTKFPGSVHFTESRSVQLLIATMSELVFCFYHLWRGKKTINEKKLTIRKWWGMPWK